MTHWLITQQQNAIQSKQIDNQLVSQSIQSLCNFIIIIIAYLLAVLATCLYALSLYLSRLDILNTPSAQLLIPPFTSHSQFTDPPAISLSLVRRIFFIFWCFILFHVCQKAKISTCPHHALCKIKISTWFYLDHCEWLLRLILQP